MSKLFATLICIATCSSAAWAGPSTASMTLTDVSSAPADAGILVSTDASDRQNESRVETTAGFDDLAPIDSHPMIPLPPAVWAGFVGLAYIARRVMQRRA